MSTKKVRIGGKPTNATIPVAADAWVESRSSDDTSGKMKRLTIDVPEHLHRKIKTSCAQRGTKITDEVRDLLLKKYGNQ